MMSSVRRTPSLSLEGMRTRTGLGDGFIWFCSHSWSSKVWETPAPEDLAVAPDRRAMVRNGMYPPCTERFTRFAQFHVDRMTSSPLLSKESASSSSEAELTP